MIDGRIEITDSEETLGRKDSKPEYIYELQELLDDHLGNMQTQVRCEHQGIQVTDSETINKI